MKRLSRIDEFNKYISGDAFSGATKTPYLFGLKYLDHFLFENNINIESLTLDNVASFADALSLKNSKATTRVYLSGIKKYLLFLSNYNIKYNFSINDIKLPKQPRQIKKEVNINKIFEIILSMGKSQNPSVQRDFIILNIILQTGITISELVKITKDKIIKNKITSVYNIEYFIDNQLADRIEGFIKNNTDLSYLFIQFSHNHTKTTHLTVKSIARMIKKYFNELSYNDLRSLHYQSLLDDLPNITQINHHQINNNSINMESINKII